LIVKKGLSVRETEALVRRLINPPDKAGSSSAGSGSSSSADANILELEGRLSDTLGARVAIEHSGKSGKGRLVVAYNSLDELDGILSHIH
jgi:ParB family chromosome partitioning protein